MSLMSVMRKSAGNTMSPVALSIEAIESEFTTDGGYELATLNAADVFGLALPYGLSSTSSILSPARWNLMMVDPNGIPATRNRCASTPLTSVGTSKYGVSSCEGAISNHTLPCLRHTVNRPGWDSAPSLNLSYGTPTSPLLGVGLPTGVMDTGTATILPSAETRAGTADTMKTSARSASAR